MNRFRRIWLWWEPRADTDQALFPLASGMLSRRTTGLLLGKQSVTV